MSDISLVYGFFFDIFAKNRGHLNYTEAVPLNIGKERIFYQADSPREIEEDREHGFYGVLVWFDCKGII